MNMHRIALTVCCLMAGASSGFSQDPGTTLRGGGDLALPGRSGGDIAGSDVAGGDVAGGDVAGGDVAGGNVAGGNVAGGDVAGGNVAGSAQEDASNNDESSQAAANPVTSRFGSPDTGGFAAGSFGTAPIDARAANSSLIHGSTIAIFTGPQGEYGGFSYTKGKWSYIKLAIDKNSVPILAEDVGAVRAGDTIAAYSGVTGSWDVLELQEGSKAQPVVSESLVQATDGDNIYMFAGSTGKWTSPNDPTFRSTSSPSMFGSAGTGSSGNPKRWIPGGVPARSSLDQQTLNLARKLQSSAVDSEEARKQLEASVKAAFDARQAKHKAEALKMKAKLETVLEVLENREALRDRIIDRRVDELLNPNVDWEAQFPSERSSLGSGAGTSGRIVAGATGFPRNAQPGQPVSGTTLPAAANDYPAATNSGSAPFGMPRASAPIGLPGPAHIPLGLPAQSQNYGGSAFDGKWRQPDEHFKSLLGRRQNAKDSVAGLKNAQRELEKYLVPLDEITIPSGFAKMDEESRANLVKNLQGNVESWREAVSSSALQWQQAWKLYETQARLLLLDVEEARVRLDAAESDYEDARRLHASKALSDTDLREAETKRSLARIAQLRAEQILDTFATSQEEMKELNPENFEFNLETAEEDGKEPKKKARY